MRNTRPYLLFVACMASFSSHGDDAAIAAGKQLAAGSGIEWSVGDIDHPVLGPIRFAKRKSDLVTSARSEKIFSNAYVSCQRRTATVAIELTNAPGTNPAGGLGPVDMPRLFCNKPAAQGATVKSEIPASWEIGALGDALARGLAPADLRQCVSIDVLQNLALPRSWGQESQRVEIRILPYAKELDLVFARCGEATAFAEDDARPAPAPAARAAPRAAPVAPQPAPARERAAPHDNAAWKTARTAPVGHTNVRSAPRVDAPVVIQLDPGVKLLAQAASGPWWKVKPVGGGNFSGYIREDRLEFERTP